MTNRFTLFAPPLHGARAGLLAAVAAVALAGAAQAGSLTPIASFADPGTSTVVLGINDAGFMTGAIGYGDGSSKGFLRDPGGVYTTFSIDFGTVGRAVGTANQVSGYAIAPGGAFNTDQEFIRSAGGSVTILQNPATSTDLHGIAQGMNSLGAVVGDYYTGIGAQRHGFVLAGGVLTDLSVPGSTRTLARGIADDGTVAGWTLIGGLTEGFIYSGGVYSLVNDPLAAGFTTLEGLNNNGLASGEWADAGGALHAFLYNTLTHLFTEINVPGATNSEAFGLNDLGQVVVTTDIAKGPNNFLFDIHGVPEPQTWALMLVGFAGAGAALRRQRMRPATA